MFGRDEAPDAPLFHFIEGARRRGVRIAGLVQERAPDGLCDRHDLSVHDLMTGEILPLMQDLDSEAAGCRVDPAAVALAAGVDAQLPPTLEAIEDWRRTIASAVRRPYAGV